MDVRAAACRYSAARAFATKCRSFVDVPMVMFYFGVDSPFPAGARLLQVKLYAWMRGWAVSTHKLGRLDNADVLASINNPQCIQLQHTSSMPFLNLS